MSKVKKTNIFIAFIVAAVLFLTSWFTGRKKKRKKNILR